MILPRWNGPRIGSEKRRTDDGEEARYKPEVKAVAGRRKGEDAAVRQESIAQFLDDPEKLRELRRQYEERKRREASERRRKGRYQSRGMSM